jgi:N4-gp56 family major capsid protein
MAAVTWADHGGYYYSPELSKTLRYQAQPLYRFRQFVSVKNALGKEKGSSWNFDKISNISTAGGTLVETATMPERTYTPTIGTGSITEYGNAIPLTRKATELSQFDLEQIIRKVLRNDMAKALDSAVYAEFRNCQIKYVGTSTAGSAITTNGTATATNTSVLNAWHIKTIVDYMRQTLHIPPWDNEGNYICLAPTLPIRNLHDALETTAMYTEFPFPGEVGRYYDCRFLRETGSCDNSIGTGTTGEAFFFGEDTVTEAIAVPEEIIAKIPTDYGRSKGLAWYFLGGYKINWEHDPDDRIVHWTSSAE